MLMDVLLYWTSGIFVLIFHLYCWYSLLIEKINWKKSKIYIVILIMTSIGTLLNYICPQFIKMILTMLYLIIACYWILRRDIKVTVLVVIFSQFIVMFSELVLVIILPLLFGNSINEFSTTSYGGLIINLLIALFSLLILKSGMPKKLFDYILKYVKVMKKKEVLTYLIMIIMIVIISTAESYMEFPTEVILITNTAMALIFIFMVIKFAIAEDKYARTNSKYQVSITSLKEYQEMLDKYRISNHENKNQLLTIKTMVKDPKVISYIDAIVDEKTKDNEKIMNKAYRIPDERFRSIIYPKMCKVDELKIKYKFSISNDVKTADLIDMDDYLVANACSILGVFLDNAIEAVKDLKKKSIYLEIYIMDGYLCFDITNNFEGVLDIDKIYKPKYSTKGKEHGYGLEVVNKIVRENEKIENECEINKDMITQRLKVKM